MSFTFDTQKAVQRLRDSGVEEGQATATVEVVSEATSPLVTVEILRAEMAGLRAELYRALAIQGGVILAGVGVIVALVETLN